MTENKIKILKPIIDGFDEKQQKLKAIEEMSELSKELCKNIYDAKNFDQITEEMADVQIMLDQLMIIFNNEPQVKTMVARKIARTYERLGLEVK